MSVAPFDLLAPGSGAALVLFSSRVGGMVLLAPVFSAKVIPVRVKTAVVVLLSALLQPVALAGAAGTLRVTPAGVLGEFLVGIAIGLGAAVFVAAVEVAGDLMAIQTGLSGAALLDPLSSSSLPVIAQFANLLAVALLLALDAHLVMLRALAESLRLLPLGADLELTAGAAAMVGVGGTLFALGIQFAAPVVAAILVANTALALLGRAAPTLNVMAVAFPVQIGLGLFVLGASIPYIATLFGGWAASYEEVLVRLFSALAGGD